MADIPQNLDGQPDFDMLSCYCWITVGPYMTGLKAGDMIKNKFGIPYSFEVHSSINGLYRYGTLTLEDKYGIRESLPITGNEIITLAYNNGSRGSITSAQPVFIHFNIFNMEETLIDDGAEK